MLIRTHHCVAPNSAMKIFYRVRWGENSLGTSLAHELLRMGKDERGDKILHIALACDILNELRADFHSTWTRQQVESVLYICSVSRLKSRGNETQKRVYMSTDFVLLIHIRIKIALSRRFSARFFSRRNENSSLREWKFYEWTFFGHFYFLVDEALWWWRKSKFQWKCL